jgi:hypothetical protein
VRRFGPGCEESDRHRLDVIEDLRAEIEDQTFTDTCGEPTLGDSVDCRDDCEERDEARMATTKVERPLMNPSSMIAL